MHVMLKDDGCFFATGEPAECAMWAYFMMLMERESAKKQMEKDAKAEAEALAKALGMSFEDLMKQERDEKE